jgi:glycosyltransferase involved in cell wall biosynthesis
MVRDGDLAAGVCAFGTFLVKCLIVINDLARAGAEKQASLLACGLKELGWTVSVVLIKRRNDFAGDLSAAAIPVSTLNRSGPLDLGVILRLRRVIRETEPDIVLSFLFLSNLLAVLSTRGLRPGPRLVVSVRESYRRNLSVAHRLVARVAHRGAELVICNSMEVLRQEQAGFPSAARTAYLPNAVPPQVVDAVDWSDFGAAGARVVLSVGQLTPAKGHQLLIDAFLASSVDHPDARLAIVGDGPLASNLRAQAEACGLADRVLFLGHRADALRFIAAADVFVQPSLSEGMPNAVMEAMMLGRCIVATRVGATPDLLEDGVHGLLAHPAAQDLARALGRALTDPELRIRLGAAARVRAEQFSAPRVSSSLDATLREVLKGSSH